MRAELPSVYIDFERAGILRSPGERVGEERVWLRLHNNTRWPIMIDMGDVPSKEYGEAEIFYDLLSGGQLIFPGQCIDVCTLNKVGTGKSLEFSLPREDLADGRTIRISFSYSRENQNDVSGGREVEHYVYFRSSQLPHRVQLNVK